MAKIPVIDLRLAGSSPAESTRLRDACERLGCFRVSGHGVPARLQAEMKAAVRALFDLPDEAKRRNADIIAGSGYVAPSPANPLYEAFGLLDAAAPADVDAFCARLDAPPHGDGEELCGEDTRPDRGRGGQGGDEPGAGASRVRDWPCQFRMNRYNYTEDTVGKPGVQVHTDSGFLTVLQEDECVGGLEVLDPAVGSFVPVHPVAGSFVVNIGDVGTAWSNGRLHNVKHRVQCVAPVPRISIAMFLLAPRDDRVSAPEAFVDADHPRRFREFKYDDYRKLRLSTGERAGEVLARVAA
ncbi:hypothetical protein PR202_ga19963 [Eleusine coracana subsp. coracana]|uniref:Fe2OG dioxygenase domain-containing protein n=1 Tax=Eleusine coracana subsp. coracana TaxID=191504 RepID=A0AAV5CWT3_ELECO|nr:hypothetical protein PR202_ga19963 [Eleusine coracana subsp. coracana]